jgi:hypothetical protein
MNDEILDEHIFIYMGKRGVDVPLDVIHVSIHHSVSCIHSYAFSGRSQLRTVTGGHILEEIQRGSFARCDSLREITITPTVRLIEDKAFYRCSLLTTVNGGESLKMIERRAFSYCTSLREITISPYVTVIEKETFDHCSELTTVNGGDGLEKIEEGAFSYCTSLREITFSPRVKYINAAAFECCYGLTTVNGGVGLRRIERCAFFGCRSLREVTIHRSVKIIEDSAFHWCEQLTTVNLSEGLSSIMEFAFGKCTSLQRLIIPSSVIEIERAAFARCTSLTSVVFCNRIQEFVTTKESMRNWWNGGIHKRSTRTYCFLVKHQIPQRLELLRPLTLQADIHGMLACIPRVSTHSLERHFKTIDQKLHSYQHLMNAFSLLEQGLWKSIIIEQIFQRSNGSITVDTLKIRCRDVAINMLNQIVPLVIPFLIDENDDGNVVVYDDDSWPSASE